MPLFIIISGYLCGQGKKIENFKKRKEIAKYLFKANRKNLIGNFVISKKIVLIKIKFFIKYILCLFPGKIIL